VGISLIRHALSIKYVCIFDYQLRHIEIKIVLWKTKEGIKTKRNGLTAIVFLEWGKEIVTMKI